MNRSQYLGAIDSGIPHSLLKSYSVPTKLPNVVKLNKVKHQDDLVLIELGSLLSESECDEILNSIKDEKFTNMADQYGDQIRNSWRLIVYDNRLARTLWRRLRFSHRINRLIQNTRPLGFGVQGTWKMSGVNRAMRINEYHAEEYFMPHKDSQYAPSGDERSLLSLIVYLNDGFEKGETKFYFPKQLPKSSIKGMTIIEEIEAYGGLEYGYECISIQPRKGYAVLFSHNLLHEAVAPEIQSTTSSHVTARTILRTDVIVQREDRPQ